jgi:hypothetical protein
LDLRLAGMRSVVSRQMIEVHRGSLPSWLSFTVRQMDEQELFRRFRTCLEMELSAVGPKPKGGADFFPVFGPATTTAGRAALNPVSGRRPKNRDRRPNARVGNKKPGNVGKRQKSRPSRKGF